MAVDETTAVDSLTVARSSLWWRWAWLSLGLTIVLIVALATVSAELNPSQDAKAVLSLVGESALGGVTILAVLRVSGSVNVFAAEIGLDRITRTDLANWLKGVGWQLLALVVFGIVVEAVDRHTVKEASNTTGLQHASVFALVVTGIAAVLIAPIVEETQFRALLLRAGTARYGFFPAAIGSSVIFGALHGWQVHRLGGVIVLITHGAVFGFVQCLLVRRNERLTPNVMIHASFNILALVLAATT